MKFSIRIFFGFFLVLGTTSYLFYAAFVDEIKPGLRQSAELNLVETANLLAEFVSEEVLTHTLPSGSMQQAMSAFKKRKLNALIWSLHKRDTNLNVYITDHRGIVVYHSENPQLVGEDYSQWNDVYLTLRGQYGARSTPTEAGNPLSSVMHVAAPIVHEDELIGVLTVFKPNLSFQPFFIATQHKLMKKGWLLLAVSLLAASLLAWWLSRSLQQLARYALAVKQGQPVSTPQVHGSELKQLAEAMSDMKEKLEGKHYVENYVHTLAHQLKSPIASIRGAAELLHENLPVEQRQRFIQNIEQESHRLEEIVARMLTLAELENRPQIKQKDRIDLNRTVTELLQTKTLDIQAKQLNIDNRIDTALWVEGDRFLLQQALANVLDNAIDFSPINGEIKLFAKQTDNIWHITIDDQGPGIPNYAKTRLFERFYSLPRPDSQLKSSGLGLCFVKEIMRLHDGKINLTNKPSHGVSAILSLPSTAPTN